MKAIFKISAISLVAVLCFTMGSYGQVPADSVAVKAASEQAAPVKKKKKKLTKEEKQRIKDLDAVVKTAKHKLPKEEKQRIQRLTILEQDLQNWLRDVQAEWYMAGVVELFSPDLRGSHIIKIHPIDPSIGKNDNLRGQLYIKNGATFQVRIFFEGISYDCQRVVTVFKDHMFRWYFKDSTLTTWIFNIPDELNINRGVPHTEYKEYNPWQYLIDLDKKNGVIPKNIQKK